MNFFFISVFIGFLCSPVWFSVLIALLPRKFLWLSLPICAVQALLAYAVWWWYWGGGMGCEAQLSKSWQFAFGFALLPVVTVILKKRRT